MKLLGWLRVKLETNNEFRILTIQRSDGGGMGTWYIYFEAGILNLGTYVLLTMYYPDSTFLYLLVSTQKSN